MELAFITIQYFVPTPTNARCPVSGGHKKFFNGGYAKVELLQSNRSSIMSLKKRGIHYWVAEGDWH